MNTRKLMALLLTLALLMTLGGCARRQGPGTQPENPDAEPEESYPVKLECRGGSTTLRFALDEESGSWQWGDDKSFPLEQNLPLFLVETLTGLSERMPLAQIGQLADYGLDEPSRYIDLTDNQGHTWTYCLGDEGEDGVYLYREDMPAMIYAVPNLRSQIDRSIYSMMQLPQLPQLTAENLRQVELSRGEETATLELTEELLRFLSNWELSACVDWKPSAGVPALCGLDEPQLVLTVLYEPAGTERSFSLTVGGQRSEGYCVTVSEDDTIYLMSTQALTPLLELAAARLGA